ncbi:MAG: hypothetical protein KME32_13455 [Mojavia pulchra JT2-VF2]|jgi:hypothetical protein|uniref:Uncharacterized protein n=1 Tax=Mojavia pulchra JT2-VF2 TaxID=287848 RepID=A0A951PXE6_9NOST|nr:hypothetical protein [Mojavia pulchra JT2-VF2]
MESEKIQNQEQLDYKALLANAKLALKAEYQRSSDAISQLQAIKTQLEQVQAENKILRESAYEDVIKHFEARTQAAEARALKIEVRQKFLEANGCKDDESFDTLWDSIKNQIQFKDGEVKIVAPNGTPKFTLTGNLMTLKDFVQSLKEQPKHERFFIN